MTPAYFPQPFGPPVIRTYRSLARWTGSGWVCVEYEPGCHASFSRPEILNSYDGREEYTSRLNTVSPPYLITVLWFLGTDNRWYQHRHWSNRTPDLGARWAGDPL